MINKKLFPALIAICLILASLSTCFTITSDESNISQGTVQVVGVEGPTNYAPPIIEEITLTNSKTGETFTLQSIEFKELSSWQKFKASPSFPILLLTVVILIIILLLKLQERYNR